MAINFPALFVWGFYIFGPPLDSSDSHNHPSYQVEKNECEWIILMSFTSHDDLRLKVATTMDSASAIRT